MEQGKAPAEARATARDVVSPGDRAPLLYTERPERLLRRRVGASPCGQYISNKRFSRKARGCKSTSVGADLSCPPPIYRPSLAVPLSAVFCEKCIIWSLRIAPHFLI